MVGRIVGVELKSQIYRSLFIFGVYLPDDGLIDNYRKELHALDDLYPYYISYGNVIVLLEILMLVVLNRI